MGAEPSQAITPFGIYQFSPEFFDFMKTWTKASSKGSISPTDWRIWLPRAYYLNWSDPATWQKSMWDPTIWLPMAYYPQEEKERIMNIYNIAGDMVGRDKAGGDLAGRDMIKAVGKNQDKGD